MSSAGSFYGGKASRSSGKNWYDFELCWVVNDFEVQINGVAWALAGGS